jgi:hypothetical protein
MSTATLTSPTTTSKGRAPMRASRKQSLAAGIFYLLTFVSIPTLVLYSNAHKAGFITGSGPDSSVYIGAVLEVIVALTGIGTAIALFPVVKRQNESLALGFVAARTLEAAGIIAGVASIFSLVTLRHSGVGADAEVTGQALASMYDRFFMLSQSLMPSINGVLLGTLMYRSRLVPRILPTIGLIGAPILFVYTMLAVGGVVDNFGPAAGPAALLIAVWELSLGIYLTVKGFKSLPITDAFDAEEAAKKAAFAR